MLGRLIPYGGGDVFILREVLVEAFYAPVLDILPGGPIRVVDVGANIGAFTVWLHRTRGVFEAFCFEPDPDCFKLCVFNLNHNGCHVCTVHPQAVGGTARQTEMWIVPNEPAKSTLYVRKNAVRQSRKVEVIAFGDWLRQVPGVFDLLKLDCEGAEWEILDADPTVLNRFSAIVAEVHPDPSGRHGAQDFPAILSRNGFDTVRWETRGCGLYVGRRRSKDERV